MLEILKDKMLNGIATFSFFKKDGTIRVAKGTLKTDLLPPMDEQEEKRERKTNENLQVYYDVEKNAWRCFTKSNLISVE